MRESKSWLLQGDFWRGVVQNALGGLITIGVVAVAGVMFGVIRVPSVLAVLLALLIGVAGVVLPMGTVLILKSNRWFYLPDGVYACCAVLLFAVMAFSVAWAAPAVYHAVA